MARGIHDKPPKGFWDRLYERHHALRQNAPRGSGLSRWDAWGAPEELYGITYWNGLTEPRILSLGRRIVCGALRIDEQVAEEISPDAQGAMARRFVYAMGSRIVPRFIVVCSFPSNLSPEQDPDRPKEYSGEMPLREAFTLHRSGLGRLSTADFELVETEMDRGISQEFRIILPEDNQQ
jgi:hypothetical protein